MKRGVPLRGAAKRPFLSAHERECSGRGCEACRMRGLRVRLGMTQAALAETLGCAPRRVRDIETARRPMPALVRLALAHLEHVDA